MEITELEEEHKGSQPEFYIQENASSTQVDVMYHGWYVVRFKKVEGKWMLMRHGAVRHKDIATNANQQIQLVKGG